jgi:hypothetical protein
VRTPTTRAKRRAILARLTVIVMLSVVALLRSRRAAFRARDLSDTGELDNYDRDENR